jgi:hypothetical protein
MPKVPDNIESVRKQFADMFSKRWRLVCASRVPDSILMWSHYAANHTGIVIEFDTTEKPFSEIGEELMLPVTYSEKKANYFHFNTLAEFQKAMFSVAATKAVDWSYEKEVRIVLGAGKPLRESLYLQLAPASITQVLFGCRTTGSVKLEVSAALKRTHFEHVRLMQAALDRSEYALTFREATMKTDD